MGQSAHTEPFQEQLLRVLQEAHDVSVLHGAKYVTVVVVVEVVVVLVLVVEVVVLVGRPETCREE